MKLHSNAKLTPKGRLALAQAVKEGRLTLNAAAAAFKVSERTARKWVQRFEAEGPAGLQDRSSRPMHLRAATPPKVVRRIEQLRRERMTGARIAELTACPRRPSRVACCAAWACRGCHRSIPRSLPGDTSTRPLATCCTWTPRSSVASPSRVTA